MLTYTGTRSLICGWLRYWISLSHLLYTRNTVRSPPDVTERVREGSGPGAEWGRHAPNAPPSYPSITSRLERPQSLQFTHQMCATRDQLAYKYVQLALGHLCKGLSSQHACAQVVFVRQSDKA